MKSLVRKQFSFVDKGLAVVLTACLTAMGCLAYLNWQRGRALELAATQCADLDFILRVSGLVERISNYCGLTISFVLQDKQHWRDLAALEKDKADLDLTELRERGNANRTLSQVAEHVAARFVLIRQMVEGEPGKPGIVVPGKFSSTLKRAPAFFNVLDELADEALQLIDAQRNEQQRQAVSTDSALLLQRIICVGGFVAALLASVIFLRFFYFVIRRRLRQLSANALKLADVNPQLHKIVGTDEFTRLNEILESAVVKLRQSSEARTFLLCMVAHDMRSPLAAASINLELAGAELAATDAGGKVYAALEDIREVLPFIDDLLQIEKTQSSQSSEQEEILLEDYSDTELSALAEQAAASGIELKFEFSSQVIKVALTEFTGAITLIVGYLLRNLSIGSKIILSADGQSSSDWRLFFTVNVPGAVPQPLRFLEEDLAVGGSPELSARTIKLHPALYHVHALGGELRYESFVQKNCGRLILDCSGRADSRNEFANSLAEHVSRPWLASFMLLLALPIFIQAFAFLGIFQQVREAGNLLNETQEKMQTILLLSKAEILGMKVAATTFSAVLSSNSRRRENAAAAVDASTAFISSQAEQLKHIGGLGELIKEIERVNNLEADLLKDFDSEGLLDFFHRAADVETDASAVGAAVRDAVITEQKLLESRVDELRDFGSSFKLVAIIAFLDLLVLAILAIAFRLYFVRRYRELEGHLVNLLCADDRKTGPAVKFVNDELSVLERAVDLAARRIKANSAYRRSFINVVRREIVTPIDHAQANLRTLLADGGQSADGLTQSFGAGKNRERLSQALRSLRLVLLLIDDLDSLEQFENNQINTGLVHSDFAAAALLSEAWEVLSAMAEGRRVTLLVDFADESARKLSLRGDRKRLLQALINLMGNAIKFSPSGSTVAVRAASDKKTLSIAVSDQGPGLDKAEVERLFEPFYQGESSQKSKGFGLGLSAAKYVLAAHGGALSVAETGPRGTTFVMQIPLQ